MELGTLKFEGKCVIVTGSSNGIGRAAAVEFARQGASVLIHGRNQDTIQETVKLCKGIAPGGAMFPFVQGDIADDSVVKEIADTAIKQLGSIDVLVNNAAEVQRSSLLGDMAIFDSELRVLVRAPLLLSQMCFQDLKKTGGNIVNISSINSTRVNDSVQFYNIGKAALDMFTKCAALEFGSQGVRVNSINPGLVTTSLAVRGNLCTVDEFEAFCKVFNTITPLGKDVDVEEIAKMIVFVASEDASMMNGGIVVHDGGRSLTGLDTKTLQNAAKQ